MALASKNGILYPIFAGIVGALCPVVFKLAFSDFKLSVIHLTFCVLFIACNVCGAYLDGKSYQESSATVHTVSLITGVNFFVTTLLGIVIFGESVTISWIVGLAFILIGVNILTILPPSSSSAEEEPSASDDLSVPVEDDRDREPKPHLRKRPRRID